MSILVNMMPQSLSGETHQDSEPFVSVHPANPMHIAASALVPNPMGGANAPIFVSENGGQAWRLNPIVPGNDPDLGTHDITLCFSGAGDHLYAGSLRGDIDLLHDPRVSVLNILRTDHFLDSDSMTVLERKNGEDQPFIHATTEPGGSEHIYIGMNLFVNAPDGRSATLDVSSDGGGSFTSITLETRDTAIYRDGTETIHQDGPQVRTAVHPSGVVYAAFYGWRSHDAETETIMADVVLLRDDHWGAGPPDSPPFSALRDASDGQIGRRVATNISISGGYLGQQRLGDDLAVAVDPNNSNTVYLAWAGTVGGVHTLYLAMSIDGGLTWTSSYSDYLQWVPNAINPALAVNADGILGFLYQQFVIYGTDQRWETHLLRKAIGSTWDNMLLATTPADTPVGAGDPYLGDYVCLAANGPDFSGVFCANNTPALDHFPSIPVQFQRNHNFATRQLFDMDNRTPVPASIDPFFFTVTYDFSPALHVYFEVESADSCSRFAVAGGTIDLIASVTDNPFLLPVTFDWTFPHMGEVIEPSSTYIDIDGYYKSQVRLTLPPPSPEGVVSTFSGSVQATIPHVRPLNAPFHILPESPEYTGYQIAACRYVHSLYPRLPWLINPVGPDPYRWRLFPINHQIRPLTEKDVLMLRDGAAHLVALSDAWLKDKQGGVQGGHLANEQE